MQALDKPVSPALPAQIATLKQKQTMAPGQKQMVADPTQEQQLSTEEPLDVDDIVLKNINDCDKYVNAIFGPLCSIYNSNNSNLVMGSIFNNPYSIQLDTKILLDEKDINNMYKDVSKDDKEQLKIILKDCFGISDTTKFPVVVEYFDVVQFPILMSNNKKLSGPCLNCLSVLSSKVSNMQDKRLKYSRNIGYGTFGAGTASSVVAVVSFFLVPIPFLQFASLAIMGTMTCYMTTTRIINMYDGVKNKTRSKNIKNIFEKKEAVIKFFHEKIKKYFKSQMSELNKINTPEQQLSNSNAKDQTKEKNAIDKDKLKDVFSKVGNLPKQPAVKDNDENNGGKKNDKNNNDDILKNILQNNVDNKNKKTDKDNDDNDNKRKEKSILPTKNDNNNFKKDVENEFSKNNVDKKSNNIIKENEKRDKPENEEDDIDNEVNDLDKNNDDVAYDERVNDDTFLNKNHININNIDKKANVLNESSNKNTNTNSRSIEKNKINSNKSFNETDDNIDDRANRFYRDEIKNKQNKPSSRSLKSLNLRRKSSK